MLHFQKKPILGANLRARKKLYVAVSAAKIYYFPFPSARSCYMDQGSSKSVRAKAQRQAGATGFMSRLAGASSSEDLDTDLN